MRIKTNVVSFSQPNRVAHDCIAFVHLNSGFCHRPRVVKISANWEKGDNTGEKSLHAVFLLSEYQYIAKAYWQHTGNGISSRMAQAWISKLTPSSLYVIYQFLIKQ